MTQMGPYEVNFTDIMGSRKSLALFAINVLGYRNDPFVLFLNHNNDVLLYTEDGQVSKNTDIINHINLKEKISINHKIDMIDVGTGYVITTPSQSYGVHEYFDPYEFYIIYDGNNISVNVFCDERSHQHTYDDLSPYEAIVDSTLRIVIGEE